MWRHQKGIFFLVLSIQEQTVFKMEQAKELENGLVYLLDKTSEINLVKCTHAPISTVTSSFCLPFLMNVITFNTDKNK